jgi:hypothetical protein
MSNAFSTNEANAHFNEARRQAFLNDVASLFNRESNDLLPYHEISNRTDPDSSRYGGLQTVRLDQIVGSMNRFDDFDRNFLPRNRHTMGRWLSIDRAWHNQAIFPPVQLVRVGDVYFVKDGNHRISVAKEHGQEFIDAEIVEEHLRAPLSPDMSPTELLIQAEYAEFLRRTNLDRLRPKHDIRPSELGDYDELWRHIQNHRHFLEEDYERRPVDMEEAVSRWYDRVYTPLVQMARKHQVCQAQRWTEADVYLWLMSRRDQLYERYRHTREPFGSADSYVREMAKTVARNTDIFTRMMQPFTWKSLRQRLGSKRRGR